MIPLWLLYDSGDAGIAPVIFLFSGYAFSMRPVITGGALDQPSLFKELFILGYSLLAICPCIAFVRRLNSRTHRIVRSIFAILSLIILLHPLSILTIYTYDVSRYTLQMGVTPKRLLGLALGLSVFVAMSCFVLWICRPNTRKFAQYAQWTVAAIEN